MRLFRLLPVTVLVACCLATPPVVVRRDTPLRYRVAPDGKTKIALPTKEQLDFQDNEIGALIHFEMATYTGSEPCPSPLPEPSVFNPSSIDTDQWMVSIAALGAKFATLTAKHNCGFTLWPSKVKFQTSNKQIISYNYTVEQSPVHGMDIVKSFVDSARARNIGPGLYYSVPNNKFLNIHDHKFGPTPVGPGQVSVDRQAYDQLAIDQMTELWTKYGKFTEIWFDGSYLDSQIGGIKSLLEAHQSQAVGFNGCTAQGRCVIANPARWIGNEDGNAPEENWSSGLERNGDSSSPHFCPAVCDTTLQAGRRWFFGKGQSLRSFRDMVDVYHNSVGRNCVLELDVTPDQRGLIPDDHAALYKRLGDFINSCYGNPIDTGAKHTVHNNGTYSISFESPTSIDRIVLMEDQRDGQVIRSYQVQAKVVSAGDSGDLSTVPWSLVSNGTSIGHKKIDIFEKGVINVTGVMISPTFVDTPKWRSVSVHLCLQSSSAYSEIQAEAYTSKNGTNVEQTSDTGGGDNVGWIHNGNWLGFRQVDFGGNGATRFTVRVASGASSGIKGVIHVALDSPTSTPICSLAVSNTGGWQSWKSISAGLNTVTGVHAVYLTFTSDQAADFVNVNWFKFSQ
ncbi:glycoside hydrolase family 29 protein [Pochonia chlamydosporia 170]|uniref:alpha-L-fucosidase n=1 Tax=Pochonia chlamydosporia 170 TaxID=1380566 RepID=A0A179EYC5_METCM|nr:glycoside hydrolase family 29 protein [Pochonia chlamydosporia 170]OAQ58196.1 glycoside hydrolase family 29 protein [Pochonia chlamydosporia 170]